MALDPSRRGILRIRTARTASGALVDVEIDQASGVILAVRPTDGPCDISRKPIAPFQTVSDFPPSGDEILAHGSLLLPGLVHPHLHLDKCYLLDRCQMKDGSFGEALEGTAKAKNSFTFEDLVARGRRLIESSISHGVVALRAHVEVDPTVGLTCLEAGLHLRNLYNDRCDIHLSVFAQDPLFYPSSSSKQAAMMDLLERAASTPGVASIGSAPYVEFADGGSEAKREREMVNIETVFKLAEKNCLDLDFHLDYDLDASRNPLVWDVLRRFRASSTVHHSDGGDRTRHLTLGHMTHLSLFTDVELDRLQQECEGLDVTFVALPPSDMYMMGRAKRWAERPRGSFFAPELNRRGLQTALGVNNVANLFTPQGDGDPLALLPMMVGVWQSARPTDLVQLMRMVTTGAARAAGGRSMSLPVDPMDDAQHDQPEPLDVREGQVADLVLLDGCDSLAGAVLSPPFGRTTIKAGRLTARRTVASFV